MEWSKVIAVGTGGFIGASLRYLVAVGTDRLAPDANFPFATTIVNLVGCLLIGILASTFELKEWGSAAMRLMIVVGVLGGFTTFSTFANDSFMFFGEGKALMAILNISTQVILGILFVWLGYSLVKLLQ